MNPAELARSNVAKAAKSGNYEELQAALNYLANYIDEDTLEILRGLKGEDFYNFLNAISPHFASGTIDIPRDMSANLHQGEMIIPKDFAEGIRSGELSLGGGGTTNIYINVGGNILTENDLVDIIAYRLNARRVRGQVTA